MTLASPNFHPPDCLWHFSHLNAAFADESRIVFTTRLIGNEFLVDDPAKRVLPVALANVMQKVNGVARSYWCLTPPNRALTNDNSATELGGLDDARHATNGCTAFDPRHDSSVVAPGGEQACVGKHGPGAINTAFKGTAIPGFSPSVI